MFRLEKIAKRKKIERTELVGSRNLDVNSDRTGMKRGRDLRYRQTIYCGG